MGLSESFKNPPRVTSTYQRNMYDEIVKIADQINFSDPRFLNKQKRNRSLGSVQALIVEIALSEDSFQEYLRTFMINHGREWVPVVSYQDGYRRKY